MTMRVQIALMHCGGQASKNSRFQEIKVVTHLDADLYTWLNRLVQRLLAYRGIDLTNRMHWFRYTSGSVKITVLFSAADYPGRDSISYG
ncbi:hypothetical protein SERLA73DRAFT_130094 [Serpula lacrymans var. lacrymans S7.3]|uniref:Uncharacterized protein n=2 Tax=Serpula lacrymans var. lacrymans TaxID=341189 RepID=F8PIP4_SERL3|nr:uncharacterized protein SERLADRAFT_378536 [Serpula lacrymans var. lacrymans S7.9]EGO03677.1 hypothetical protein SERLA73DRAFT_130094 [Serpula lacrymans var. lacrymans S7.3]EGO29540.1 hypothetical protein SERLADRAFT_378536 [Serpula lacrymans var. lacrymans S7.9]